MRTAEGSTPTAADGETRISFIVCTKDRQARLMRCLGSIVQAALRRPEADCEVVVVDNGSRDETHAAVLAFAETSPVPVRLAHEAFPGLGAARNTGLALASGTILAFTDDDCELHPDYVRDLVQRWSRGPRDLVRGGRVELGDPADLPFTIKTSNAVETFAKGVYPGGFVHGCNLVVTRAVAEAVGPFDPRFGTGAALQSADDTDYLLRAHLAGFPAEYVPDMCVRHYHGRRTPEQIRRLLLAYALGNGALYVKHGRRAPWLLKYVFWTGRDVLRELLAPEASPEFCVSNRRVFFANLAGAWRFLQVAGDPSQAPAKAARLDIVPASPQPGAAANLNPRSGG